jgi:diguanylate cyclase (GGDEF)-like protein
MSAAPESPPGEHGDRVASSYRQLAEIYHDLLSRDELSEVLERLVKTVKHLIPVASLLIAEAQVEQRILVPLVAEGEWPDGFVGSKLSFGEGLIGLVAERGRPILCNEAHLDPRAGHVAGTPIGEPEAIISLPLVARGVVIGAMSLYREGQGAFFSKFDFELAQRFADAATIAIENARAREELRGLVRRDELTGLFNRRGFNELLTRSLVNCDRTAVSLVLVDLDDFKSVNDCHGHVSGDEVLADVGRRLTRAVDGLGPVCRLGGDEFAVILEGIGSAGAAVVADRIRHAFADQSIVLESGELVQRASIGLASSEPLARLDAEGLLRQADMAMYVGKRGRRSTDPQPLRLRLVSDSSA